jgi:hypothetical protein
MRHLGILLIGLALVVPSSPVSAAAEEAVPITQRAIAAVTLEHAPAETTHRQATWTDPRYRGGGLGADLRYHGDGESDGDLLRVFVTPSAGPARPCQGRHPRCVSRNVDGGRLTLSWVLEEPEEDPGYVDVLMQRGDEMVEVIWAGDVIRRDPRDQHLFIPVGTLEDIAQDPRIGMTTTQAVVDAGAALPAWNGGEPDPHAGDRVPSTNRAVAHSYWLHFGGYARFHKLRPSPLRHELGGAAVGGRFVIEREGRDYPRKTVDVVAGQRRPSWMAAKVCRTPRFSGHCLRGDGRLGQRYLAWVPGPKRTGQIWAVGQRDHEFVAVRYSGLRVPAGRNDVNALSEWRLLRGYLQDRAFGLETFKYVVDAEF